MVEGVVVMIIKATHNMGMMGVRGHGNYCINQWDTSIRGPECGAGRDHRIHLCELRSTVAQLISLLKGSQEGNPCDRRNRCGT